MMKLLKLKVNGYKLLEDDFEIDLTTKARVYNDETIKEVLSIDDGLNTLRSIAFVGGNSSGKSTVLTLLLKTLIFLQTGRWEYIEREFNNTKIHLDIVFFLNHSIYKYSVDFCKIDQIIISNVNKYCPIRNEKLFESKYKKTLRKKNIEFLDNDAIDKTQLLESSLEDTSAITKLTKHEIFVDDFYTNNITTFNEVIVRNTFFTSLSSCDKNLVSSIIQLLDDSIEYIIYKNSDNVVFKRFNENEININSTELIAILSAGTFRGVELYIRAINALKLGKIFIVDEIENCFQKNLVYNLLFLFNDEEINKNGAQIIFSTHYVEILDYLKRRDGIFITHKENGKINVKNLYSNYNVRAELLKSKQFDNNVFNTSLNYNQLLKVRRNIINELCSNNDWGINGTCICQSFARKKHFKIW